MKTNHKAGVWSRARNWIGLLVLLVIILGEVWMISRFGRDCVRTVARQQVNPGFGMPGSLAAWQ